MKKLIGILALVLTLGVIVVPNLSLPQTSDTIEGQLPDDGGNHVGKLLTITDATPVDADHCGSSWADYACTVSDHDGGASLTRTCSLPDTLVVFVGDQFDVQTQRTCVFLQLDLTLTVHARDDECTATGKTQICHIPPGNPNKSHTECVAFSAVNAHLDHGDTFVWSHALQIHRHSLFGHNTRYKPGSRRSDTHCTCVGVIYRFHNHPDWRARWHFICFQQVTRRTLLKRWLITHKTGKQQVELR